MKVLIVDDELITLDFLSSALMDDDIEVYSASSASTAVDVALSVMPDLILTDLHMSGKSGLDLSAEIKSNPLLSSVPVLLISADDTAKAVKGAFHALVVDYIEKPVDARYLKKLVRIHNGIHNINEASKRFQSIVSGVMQQLPGTDICQRQAIN